MDRLLSVYSYENLSSRNSIFQIDGNFGASLYANESMLLSDHLL